MADSETTTGSGDHGATGAGGSTSGSTATGDMGLESLLATVTGVELTTLGKHLDDMDSATKGWMTGLPGGENRDKWSENMRYGYFHYEDNVRTYELINNPTSNVDFVAKFQQLQTNVAKVASDNAPGLSARRSDIAAALFERFTTVIGENSEHMRARATALGADDSSIRGSAATALLAELTAQQKSLASMHRQLTDDNGVAAALRTVAEAVRTFELSVQNTWNQHQAAISTRALQAKAAVMEDIVQYIEDADRAWRAGAKGRNGMSVEHAKGVFAAYTWGDRAHLAPEGFTSVGGDLRDPQTYGPINHAISQSVRSILATIAAEVFAAQQKLETTMRTSLRALKEMQDPTVIAETSPPPYPGAGGPGGGGVNGPGGGNNVPDLTDLFGGTPGAGGASGNGDGVFGSGPGGGMGGASGNGDGVFGSGPGGGVGGASGNGDGVFGSSPGSGTGGGAGGSLGGASGGSGFGAADDLTGGGAGNWSGGDSGIGQGIGGMGVVGASGGGAGGGFGGARGTNRGSENERPGSAGSGYDDGAALVPDDVVAPEFDAPGADFAGLTAPSELEGGAGVSGSLPPIGTGAGGTVSSGAGVGAGSGANWTAPDANGGPAGLGIDLGAGAGGTDPGWASGGAGFGDVGAGSGGTDPGWASGGAGVGGVGGGSGGADPGWASGGAGFGDVGAGAGGSGAGWSPGGAGFGDVGAGSGGTDPGWASGGAGVGGVGAGSDGAAGSGSDWASGGAGFGDVGAGAGGSGAGWSPGSGDDWAVGGVGAGQGGGAGSGSGVDWSSGGGLGDDFAAGGGAGFGGGAGDFATASGGGGYSPGGAGAGGGYSPGGAGAGGGGALDDAASFGSAGGRGDAGGDVWGAAAGSRPADGFAAGGGAGNGAGAANGGGMGGGGMPMMPMSPQSQASRDRDRERNTWLSEDESVWGTSNAEGNGVVGLSEERELAQPTHVPAGVAAGRAPVASRRAESGASEEAAVAQQKGS
ncbi:hypothetical protein [uncultured Microbacterium sp.]|uniref:hypothetical protein n=1 Tax=uncultured Microbacterium sp. TaxID=191216 RepID=UPI003748BA47